jgi:hypothetical protein
MKLAKYLPLLLALSACGGDYKDPENAATGKEAVFGSQKVRIVSGNLDVSGAAIQGTGSVVFDSRYDQFKSGGSYALDFTVEDGGSVTVVSHANEALASGFEVEYQREGAALKVTLRAQGQTWAAGNNFNGIDAAGALKFQVDVHNDETPSHVIVWNRLLGDNFAGPSAILNSAEEVDGSPGIGTGTRWGLILNKASVTRADRTDPKFED